jgi:hypothetical protein
VIVGARAREYGDSIAVRRIATDADERQVTRFGPHGAGRGRDAHVDAPALVFAAERIQLFTPAISRNGA